MDLRLLAGILEKRINELVKPAIDSYELDINKGKHQYQSPQRQQIVAAAPKNLELTRTKLANVMECLHAARNGKLLGKQRSFLNECTFEFPFFYTAAGEEPPLTYHMINLFFNRILQLIPESEVFAPGTERKAPAAPPATAPAAPPS